MTIEMPALAEHLAAHPEQIDVLRRAAKPAPDGLTDVLDAAVEGRYDVTATMDPAAVASAEPVQEATEVLFDLAESRQDASDRMREVNFRLATNALSPNDTYPVPTREHFEIPDPNRKADDEPAYHDYLPGDDIGRIAATLIGRHGMKHLASSTDVQVGIWQAPKIAYRWKREGGATGGELRFGMVKRPDPFVRDEMGIDLLMWLAADHVRAHRYTARQMEAQVYHLLLGVQLNDAGRLAIVPPPIKAHGEELRVYGLWRPSLKIIGRSLQPQLPGIEGM